MDDRLGDLAQGDVLVRAGRIVQVAPAIEVPPGAEVLDLAGCILTPGFVNAHMHTWQTALRGVAADWTLLEYFDWVHKGLATRYRPEDIHVATLAGALGQLDAGTTTLGDWCHNNPTPAHTDAAVEALEASGIRAVFFHGSPKPDPRPGEPHFSEVPHPRHEILRLLDRLGGSGRLVTPGMAILGPHYSTLAVARHDLALAREAGLVASMHQGGGPAKSPGGWEELLAEGLVGPQVNIVHGNNLPDELLRTFVGHGATFSVTPENEMTQGHGFPITGRLRALGAAPSLGVDLESLASSSMATVARFALGCQRALDNAAFRNAQGGIPPTTTIPAREALRWITVEGARALGLLERIGTLTPGKQADIVVFRPRRLGAVPVHDPVATVLFQCEGADVDAVLVEGRFAKRDGRLLADTGRLRAQLAASGRRILGELGLAAPFFQPPAGA
jgi:cytosine/adenosine deaminase-related metal-dependent hydrolase